MNDQAMRRRNRQAAGALLAIVGGVSWMLDGSIPITEQPYLLTLTIMVAPVLLAVGLVVLVANLAT
jgi:hypothetical protein